MPFVVVYDAAALYPNAQRDLLIRIGQHGLVQAKWKWDIEAKSPDDFVLDQISIDDRIVYTCVQAIANNRSRPPKTVEDVLAELENVGLVASVAALRT